LADAKAEAKAEAGRFATGVLRTNALRALGNTIAVLRLRPPYGGSDPRPWSASVRSTALPRWGEQVRETVATRRGDSQALRAVAMQTTTSCAAKRFAQGDADDYAVCRRATCGRERECAVRGRAMKWQCDACPRGHEPSQESRGGPSRSSIGRQPTLEQRRSGKQDAAGHRRATKDDGPHEDAAAEAAKPWPSIGRRATKKQTNDNQPKHTDRA
jgi:hypothetical protein